MRLLRRARARSLYARPQKVESAEGCVFYHSMTIHGHGEVEGAWDLQGREASYLGGVELKDRRVLEIGPASGYLTFFMESQGADIVAVELAADEEWDMVPHAQLDIARIEAERKPIMDGLRQGFWFAHERHGSRSQVHYGSAHRLPARLGRFDLAVTGAVLVAYARPARDQQRLRAAR